METELQQTEALDYFEFCGKAAHFLVHNDYYDAERPRRGVREAQNYFFRGRTVRCKCFGCQFVNL